MPDIEVTDAIRRALVAVTVAQKHYRPGLDSYSVIEIPKLALADAVLAAIETQRAERLAKLPARAVPVGVEIEMRPKGRRRRA